MRRFHNLLSEQTAKSAARLMKYACYFVIFIFCIGMVLSIIGRQTFTLHIGADTYENVMYSNYEHTRTATGLFVGSGDEIRIVTDERIDVVTQIGLSAMYAVGIIPLIICMWLLSRVFANVSEGRIFTEKNAEYLLYYGVLRIASAVCVPFIKLFISNIANMFATSKIFFSTGHTMLNDIVANIAFIVAAYIIHYGVRLQDESDHTI